MTSSEISKTINHYSLLLCRVIKKNIQQHEIIKLLLFSISDRPEVKQTPSDLLNTIDWVFSSPKIRQYPKQHSHKNQNGLPFAISHRVHIHHVMCFKGKCWWRTDSQISLFFSSSLICNASVPPKSHRNHPPYTQHRKNARWSERIRK